MPETPQLMPSKNGFENTVKNQDGSIDLFFGPTKPEGVAETNWIQRPYKVGTSWQSSACTEPISSSSTRRGNPMTS
jgi:hypothetical protein